MMQSQGVKSYIRVRPVIEQDIWDNHSQIKRMAPLCVVVDQDERTVVIKSKLYEHRQFRCAHAFDHNSSQEMVYKRTISRDIKHGVLTEGKDLTILAYGNTCAGKSYTMFNYEPENQRAIVNPDGRKREEAHDEKRHQSDGLAFQCIDELYRTKERESEISITFCQLYMEKFYDLLSHDGKPREIRENIRKGVFVENLESISCSSSEEAYDVVQTGLAARIRRRTSLNVRSSRAHAILTISISNGDGKPVIVRFFDLAGSEKLSASENRINKNSLKESVTINKSISCLSNVIHKLCTRQKDNKDNKVFIPFRDSKLTRLLSTSLRSAAQISIISNICPTHEYYESTATTLKFALKAMKIDLNPNLVPPISDKEQVEAAAEGGGHHLYMMKGVQSLSIPPARVEIGKSQSHPYLLSSLPPPAAHQSKGADMDEEEQGTERGTLLQQHTAPPISQKMYTSRSVERMMRSLGCRKEIISREIESMEHSRLAQAERFQQVSQAMSTAALEAAVAPADDDTSDAGENNGAAAPAPVMVMDDTKAEAAPSVKLEPAKLKVPVINSKKVHMMAARELDPEEEYAEALEPAATKTPMMDSSKLREAPPAHAPAPAPAPAPVRRVKLEPAATKTPMMDSSKLREESEDKSKQTSLSSPRRVGSLQPSSISKAPNMDSAKLREEKNLREAQACLKEARGSVKLLSPVRAVSMKAKTPPAPASVARASTKPQPDSRKMPLRAAAPLEPEEEEARASAKQSALSYMDDEDEDEDESSSGDDEEYGTDGLHLI